MGSSRFAAGLAFGALAFDVGLGRLAVALLGDARDVEHAVDAPVTAEVEPVRIGARSPLPDDNATAPVPHQRANFDLRALLR